MNFIGNKVIRPVIFGCKSEQLTQEEKIFFQQVNPLGLILFARNCKTPQQVRDLISEFKECVGRDNVFVLVDQEGGRVRRLRPNHWHTAYSARTLGNIKNKAERERALVMNTTVIAYDLCSSGINVNCAPVLDISYPYTNDVIGESCLQ